MLSTRLDVATTEDPLVCREEESVQTGYARELDMCRGEEKRMDQRGGGNEREMGYEEEQNWVSAVKQEGEQEELERWLHELMCCGALELAVQRNVFRDVLRDWYDSVPGWCRAQAGGCEAIAGQREETDSEQEWTEEQEEEQTEEQKEEIALLQLQLRTWSRITGMILKGYHHRRKQKKKKKKKQKNKADRSPPAAVREWGLQPPAAVSEGAAEEVLQEYFDR
jgi:hypothetical protein